MHCHFCSCAVQNVETGVRVEKGWGLGEHQVVLLMNENFGQLGEHQVVLLMNENFGQFKVRHKNHTTVQFGQNRVGGGINVHRKHSTKYETVAMIQNKLLAQSYRG